MLQLVPGAVDEVEQVLMVLRGAKAIGLLLRPRALLRPALDADAIQGADRAGSVLAGGAMDVDRRRGIRMMSRMLSMAEARGLAAVVIGKR